MSNRVVAKLFKHGGSQALRLPKEFRFKGDTVLLTKQGDKVVIEPEKFDFQSWFERLDEFRDDSFMSEGRPPQGEPEKRDSFD